MAYNGLNRQMAEESVEVSQIFKRSSEEIMNILKENQAALSIQFLLIILARFSSFTALFLKFECLLLSSDSQLHFLPCRIRKNMIIN